MHRESTLFTATVALIAGKSDVSLKSASRIVHSTKCTVRAHYSLHCGSDCGSELESVMLSLKFSV